MRAMAVRVDNLSCEKPPVSNQPVWKGIGSSVTMGEDVVPIPGTKGVKYLEDNPAALEVVLSEEGWAGWTAHSRPMRLPASAIMPKA